jgi:hypothetical protein
VSPSPTLNYRNNSHSNGHNNNNNNNNGSRLLLCRWTPLPPSGAAAAATSSSEDPPKRKFRYTPVSKTQPGMSFVSEFCFLFLVFHLLAILVLLITL